MQSVMLLAQPQQAEGIKSPHIHGEPPPALARTTVTNPWLLWCNTKMFLLLWDKKRSPIKVTPCTSSPKDTTLTWATKLGHLPVWWRSLHLPGGDKQPQDRWMQCSLLGRELPSLQHLTCVFSLGYDTTTTEEKHLQFWRLLGFRKMAH